MSRGRLFGTLCSMVLLVNLARVVFAPLLSELIDVFHVGEATAGLIVTLVWFGSALPRIPTGWLLTHAPRHRVVLATGLVLTVAAAFTAAATSVPLLAVGALLMGLSSGVYFVAANPLVSELYPERVGRAMGIHGTASQLAAVAAAPFVTLVLSAALSWRAVFVAIGVAAFVVTVALYWTTTRADLPDAGRDDRDFLGAVRTQWRLVLFGVVILGATGFVWQGLFNFYELYMRTKGLSDAWARNLLTVIFAAGVPAFFVSGRLADRLPHVPYLLGIVAAFVVGVAALIRLDGTLALVLATAFVGYAVHSLFPALDTFLLDTLPDENRASAYAVYSGGMMVIQAAGPSVVGALAERGVTYDAIFTGFALALGGVVCVLLVARQGGRLPA